MNRWKQIIYTALAAILVITAAGVAFFWELYGDKINTKQIIKASRTIEQHQVITKEDLTISNVAANEYIEGSMEYVDEIIGVESNTIIPTGMAIHRSHLDFDGTVPNNDEGIYPIPNQWITAIPGSLRSKDHIYIYIFPANGEGEETVENLLPMATKLFQEEIKVAFIRDRGNQTIKGVGGQSDRADGTAVPSDSELILSEKQFETITKKIQEGYKLIYVRK